MKAPPSKMRVFGLLIVGGLLVYFAVKFFTGKAPIIEETSVSVKRPPKIESVPGSVKDNERYKELQEKENQRRAQEGKSSGVSALPTLVNRLKDEKTDQQFFEEVTAPPTPAANEKSSREEALKRAQEEADKRLKAQQERLDKLRQDQENRRQAAANARQNEKDMKDRTKIVQDMSNAILADMNGLVGPFRNPPRQGYIVGTETILTPSVSSDSQKASTAVPLYKAGSIIYGVIISNYDSDNAGTIRARIVNGPLAGAMLLGSAGTPPSQFTKNVPITFSTLSLPHAARSQSISLIAVDAETQMPGTPAEVNAHYGQRYGAMMLSSLVNQISQQIESSTSASSSNTTVQSQGASTSGSQSSSSSSSSTTDASTLTTPVLSDIASSLNTISSRPTTYTIAQGTPIGLMFTNDFVLEF
jgi:type IV secretory pathway VirB10-like protein